jgi:hypothetical protein
MGIYTYIKHSNALGNSKVHYRIHNIQSLKHALCQFSPVHTLALYFVKVYFNICAYGSQMDSTFYVFCLTF